MPTKYPDLHIVKCSLTTLMIQQTLIPVYCTASYATDGGLKPIDSAHNRKNVSLCKVP